MGRYHFTLFFVLCFVSYGYSQNGEVAAPIRAAADAPQPLSPTESAKRIRLPDGFRIDLIASEPVVQEPSCIAFDEWGRLFVCELHGYNVEGEIDVAELNKTGELDTKVRRIRWELKGGKIAEAAAKRQFGVVKLLRDIDNDGQMDESIVWAEGLPPCYGVVPANGGIIVTCAPDILFLVDTDQDGKPDVRKVLFTGFETEVLERGVNNPRWGIDNWIYVGSGGRGGTITGPNLKEPVKLGTSDFRIKPDGSAIEPVNGSVGTFGMTINDAGDRFPASGGSPANYAFPLPYRYLVRNPHVSTPRTTLSAVNYNQGFRISEPHPWRVRRRQDPEWIKFYGDRETNSNYFSGGCSNEFYGDRLFPEKFRGNLFYCEPSLNIIHRCELERDGPGYKGRRAAEHASSEFLASTDQWFRPMNLRVGPYGALYIVDMYREIIEDYSAIPRFLQQQYGLDKGRDRGRIWRLSPADAKLPPVPNVAAYSNEQLIAAAVNPDSRWLRNTARRLLVERNDSKSIRALRIALRDSARTPQAKINLLYTLSGLNALKPVEDLVSHISPEINKDYRLRVHAIRLAEKYMTDSTTQVSVVAAIHDPDPSVRLQATLSLGRLGSLEHSDGDKKTLEAHSHPLHRVAERHGGDQWMDHAILSSAREISGKLARDILTLNSGPTANSLPLLKPLSATAAGERDAKSISLILKSVATSNENTQIECLSGLIEGLSDGEKIKLSDDALVGLARLLRSDSESVRDLTVNCSVKMGLQQDSFLGDTLKRAANVAVDKNALVSHRVRAISTLSLAPFDQLSVVAEILHPSEPSDLQAAAVGALSDSDDERIGKVLLKHWSGYSPQIRNLVLAAMFARSDRLPYLLDAIESGSVAQNEISATQRAQLFQADPATAVRAKRIFAPADDAVVQKRVDRYQAALALGRNHENGKRVFAKYCINCHKHGTDGHDVGPNLGTVVNKPDETVLLDILKPSDRIESDYRSYLIATDDGRTVTGVLQSETPTSVLLAKEKGETISVLRRDIESMRALDVSMMPSNLHEQITPTQMADLIGWMRHAFATDEGIK